MRDGEIIYRQQNDAKRIAMIYRQMLFIDTRLQAFETSLVSRWDILKAIFNPKSFMVSVNNKQSALLKEHDDRVRELTEKQKQEGQKPKLSIIGANGLKLTALLCMLVASGCVSKKRYNADLLQCRIENAVLKIENTAKTDRLRKFNQVNEDGSLRTKKNDDSIGWDESEEDMNGR